MPQAVLTALLVALILAAPADQGYAQNRASIDLPAAGLVEILGGQLGVGCWQVYRWESFPDVYIVHFENYLLQGRALNRMATYCEKVGTRGRVLSDRQLAYYLRQNNYSTENLYSAHDYRTSDLASLYNAARAAGQQLGEEELAIQGALADLGLLRWDADEERWRATGEQAVLSFATRYLGREQPSCELLGRPDRRFEAHALYHESRHGLYFTEPQYAARCREYWHDVLGADDREVLRLVLLANDYDAADEELMINEWQAYLLTPAHDYVGLTALSGGLRRIASGQWRPRGLSYPQLQLVQRHGDRLAADLENWMADDLRRWLGPAWDVPAVKDINSLRGGG